MTTIIGASNSMEKKTRSKDVRNDWYCRVERHSQSEAGVEIFTMVVTFPRMILAEVKNHRDISSNSCSSRAIPAMTMIDLIEKNPYIPKRVFHNCSGMSPSTVLSEKDQKLFQEFSMEMLSSTIRICKILACQDLETGLNIHKETINRYLEPWSWTTMIMTATGWDNFFALRTPIRGPQEEHRKLARMIYLSQMGSIPDILPIGAWHIPFLFKDERSWLDFEYNHGSDRFRNLRDSKMMLNRLLELSVARNGRVSFLTQNGLRDAQEDRNLYRRLNDAYPKHMTPFEHPAQALEDPKIRSGTLHGYLQYRKLIQGEYIESFRHPEESELKLWEAEIGDAIDTTPSL